MRSSAPDADRHVTVSESRLPCPFQITTRICYVLRLLRRRVITVFNSTRSRMGRKLFICGSFRRNKCFLLILLLFFISTIVICYVDFVLIFMGLRVRNTAPITWRDPTMRHILVNNTVSKELAKKIRVLCIVPSSASNEKTKVLAVNNTWGARCNKLLFVFSRHRSAFNHINLNISDGRSHLTAKTMEAFRYVYEHFADDFDWIVKADDDSYLILENLRLLLSNFDPNEPAYLGYHFKVLVHNGYMSGGGSYVLSKSALRMLVKDGLGDNGKCTGNSGDEDMEVGRCMELLGVMPYVTQDKFGRDTFHPNSMAQNIVGPLSWYLKDYPVNTPHAGPECCSQFSISFHYVTPDMMYIIDVLLYRISVYGTVDLPHQQLRVVFTKQVSEIKHNSEDETYPIKKYYAAPNYLPQEYPKDSNGVG